MFFHGFLYVYRRVITNDSIDRSNMGWIHCVLQNASHKRENVDKPLGFRMFQQFVTIIFCFSYPNFCDICMTTSLILWIQLVCCYLLFSSLKGVKLSVTPWFSRWKRRVMSRGWLLTLQGYSAAISACEKTGQWQQALGEPKGSFA